MLIRAVVTLVAAAAVLSACTRSDDPRPGPVEVSPSSVATPGEGELTPGFDQPGDAPVTPDADLTAGQVTALLRVRATDGGTEGRCRPDDLAVTIGNLDAAAGHRFGRIVVKNKESAACTVRGYPGIGARGAWGNTFQLAAEQRQPLMDGVTPRARTITLRPGGTAFADLEWTGELAGAESEPASSLALQLSRAQGAFLVPATGAVAADSGAASGQAQPLDIGILTTVRVGPFRTE